MFIALSKHTYGNLSGDHRRRGADRSVVVIGRVKKGNGELEAGDDNKSQAREINSRAFPRSLEPGQ